MNRVILSGRIGNEIELRKTTSGKSVTNIMLAVNRDKDSVDWINVALWENKAEFVSNYAKKGSMLLIDGHLNVNKYTDKEGRNAVSYTVVADRVEMPRQPGGNANVPYESEEEFPF